MRRNAFTIIELMVTMVVMVILMGMVAVALSSAQADARIARAEAHVLKVKSIVDMRLESFRTRRYRVETRALPAYGGPLRLSAPQAGQARLMMIRDQMRMELPDRISDIAVPPRTLWVPGQPPASPGTTVWGPIDPEVIQASANTRQPDRSPTQDRYQRRVIQLLFSAGKINERRWDHALEYWTGDGAGGEKNYEHESAECLYLILAESSLDGFPALDLFNDSEIGDTNENGIPEILDPWGNPVLWIRWPVGYWLTYAIREQVAQDPAALPVYRHMVEQRLRLGPDFNDVMLSDWRLHANAKDEPLTNHDGSGTHEDDLDPFNLPPLIISAGPDGVFDIRHRVEVGSEGLVYDDGTRYLAYGNMRWPESRTWGPSNQPQDYVYPDPYQASYLPGGWTSMVGAFSGNIGDDRSADNIFSGVAQ